MEQNIFNLFGAITAVISLIITIVGLYAVYIQLRKIQETTWSNTHSKLADQSFELLKFMSEKPDTYDFFYKNKPLKEDTPDKVTILYTAEALANFMEHLILQKENLPDKQWMVWKRFIYITFNSSIVVSNFVQENNEWYSLELLEISNECRQSNV